ncbi:hypothetical protein P9112_006908 [Eukaryota sp. TZLM1-RC]
MGLSFDLLLSSPDLRSLSVRPSEDTKVRAVYTYLFLGCTQKRTAELFSVSQSSISKWVKYYLSIKSRQERILAGLYVSDEETTDDDCSSHDPRCVLTSEEALELLDFVEKDPLSFLREIRTFVRSQFNKSISITTVHRILVRHGYSYKKCQTLVRRAKLSLITQFEGNYMLDIGLVLHHQLVFIDELSFKTQVNAHSYGRSPKGQSIYTVQPEMLEVQVSAAVAIDVRGTLFYHVQEGHFDRHGFAAFLHDLINSKNLYTFPGHRSVLILDGCRIHTSDFLIHAVRKCGLHYRILPPYCPAMNPIEMFFSVLRRKVRGITHNQDKVYGIDVVQTALQNLADFNCRGFFNRCGWIDLRSINSPYSRPDSQLLAALNH